jgi:hypothetical protein
MITNYRVLFHPAKKYFTAGLMQGVIKVKPQKEGSNLSDSSNNNQKNVDTMGLGPIDDG